MLVFDAAEGGYQKSLHFVGGTGDCGLDVVGVVGDCEGLVIFWPGFEQAAFVLEAGFVTVFVGEMDFYAGEFIFVSVQDAVEIGFDQVGEFCVHRNILVAVDHNLHSLLLLLT